MNHAQIKAVLEGVIPEVKTAIERATRPLLDRIDVLEKRSPEKGEPGAPGRDGADGQDGASVSIDDVLPLIALHVTREVAGLPVPKDGEPGIPGAPGRDGADGKDGKSVTVDDVVPLLVTEIETRFAAIPLPKDGEPGAPGRDGADGKDGKSVTADDVVPLLTDLVSKAVAELPPPKKGEPGQDGRDGRDASDIPMLKGFIADEVRSFGTEVFNTFNVLSEDGCRTLTFTFDVAGETVRREIKTALVLDRGVWRAGPFVRGDGVSFGGSFFVAQQDTEEKPETGSAWRLAVKRGRDGRDGKNGEPGPIGAKGEKGEIGPRGFPSA